MMRRKSFKAEEAVEAHYRYESGESITDIAQGMGRAQSTVSTWLAKFRDGYARVEGNELIWNGKRMPIDARKPTGRVAPDPVVPVQPTREWQDEMSQMTRSAMSSPAAREQIGSDDRPDVRPHWEGGDDAAMLWQQAEKHNEKAVNKAIKRSNFSVKLGNDPVGIAFVSDQHISAQNSVCLKRMREDAELIAATPNLFACLGGDGVDNHVKHRSALLAARSTPGDQWLLYEYYLSLFAHKILAMISGNHDAWTEGFAGFDMVNWIAQKNKICYAPAEAHLDVDVGGQQYLISFRHQYRMNSTFNETHAVKQWLRHGDRPFDVGCVCHHHSPAVEECLIMGEHRIFCRPGSYQITSSHSRQYGYNLTTPTCPTIVFYPSERRIVGFYGVQDAAKWLRMELGK